MGLDAVVFRNLTNLPESLRAQVERVDPETGEMHFLSSESGVTRSVEALTAASIRLGKCLHDLVARTRDPIKMSHMFIAFGARSV